MRRFAAFVTGGAGDAQLETTIMPSNRKKHIRARRRKTGQSHSTVVREYHASIRPNLPRKPTTAHYDMQGNRLPNEGLPQFELVHIQGDFDPDDLSKAWVPSTAFDDPTMPWPRHVKRALTLAEYIEARARQMGWRLYSLQPGPLVFMGKTLNVMLSWDTREPGRQP